MKAVLHSARFGFANNSSSTHSVVLTSSPLRSSPAGGGEYGWDKFVLSTPAMKYSYLATALYLDLAPLVGDVLARELVQSRIPGGVIGEYIDHQSRQGLPVDHNGYIHAEFLEDVKTFLRRDDIAILGGNDNEDEWTPDGVEKRYWLWEGARFVVRKDKAYGYYTFFNPVNGNKYRISFHEKWPGDFVVAHASAPELVDVKITNRCMKGCAYCYQGSTADGADAKGCDIYRLVDTLSQLEVFEVAIGGGEPVLAKEFPNMVGLLRSRGVVPNFTTRELDWMYIPRIADAVREHCGSFAYSVQRGCEVSEFADILQKTLPEFDGKVSVQIVIGTVPARDLQDILRRAYDSGFQCTLLGFKKAGRGASYNIPYSETWVDVVAKLRKENKCPYIGIDTTLATKSKEALEKLDIPEWLYEVRDGRFSCYVDLVSKKVGPTSYSMEEEMKPLGEDWGADICGMISENER